MAPVSDATASTGPPGLARAPAAMGNHGMKPDPLGLAVVEHVLGRAVGQVVEVLHAGHRHHGPGRLDLVHADLAEPDAADLALVEQVGQQAELLLGRHLGVDAVELEEVDGLDPEASQAHLALLAQVLGPAHRQPLARPLPGEPGLGGDDQALGIGVEGLEDDVLADLGTVGVGGVDEVDAQLDGPAQHGRRTRPGRPARPRPRRR